ncbi:MAG TPA: ScpA family protein [Ktedonobacterales bacterium]|nr:ScpA family protein [Ktedonobacterales bacterium]
MAAVVTTPPDIDGIDRVDGPAPWAVHLPGFDGPLDLLLHLIERNQLEITAISLVAVTDQFVAYLRMWDEPPLPRLAEFVTMAARLLLIKSRSLLPRQPRQETTDDETDPLDDAEQLRRHLLEYKLAKDIASMLRARELAGLQSFTRQERLVMDPDAVLRWTPPKLVGLNVNALSHVFRKVLTEKRFSEPEELPLPLVTVAEKMAEVEALLARRRKIPLEDILLTADSRFAVVVTFLAVLEMWHQSRIAVEQDELFGPIYVLRSKAAPALAEAAPADETSTEIPAEMSPAAPEKKPRRARRSPTARADNT